MNNKQRKRFMSFMGPYGILVAGIIVLLGMIIMLFPTEPHAIIEFLPTLLTVLALLILIAIAMVAGDIFYLRLYLEREL